MIVINIDDDNDIYDDNDDDIYDDNDDDKNRNKNKILFPWPGDPNNPPFYVYARASIWNCLLMTLTTMNDTHEDRGCCVSLPKQQDGQSKNVIHHKCQICSAQV